MASAWGNSWGSAWGNSWGTISSDTIAGSQWRNIRRDKREQIEADDEEIIGAVLAFIAQQELH